MSSRPLSDNRLPQLDGLRGFAILLVLIWHLSEFVPIGDGRLSSVPFIGLCWSGVDLFFVLSGFLLGGILIDHRMANNLWTAFYVRRAFRILPLYLVMLLTFVVFLYFDLPSLSWLFTDGVTLPLASYFSLTQNIFVAVSDSFGSNFLGPSWSLAVEEQFYLIIPFMIRLTPPAALPWILASSVGAAIVSRILVYHVYSANHFLASYSLLPCRADALLIGVLCAWFVRRPYFEEPSAQWTLTTLFAILSAGTVWLGIRSSGFGHREMIFFGFTWLAAFYGALLLILVRANWTTLIEFFVLPPLRRLGQIAYAVYLLHIPIIGTVHGVLFYNKPVIGSAAEFLATFFAIGAIVLLAQASMKYFEEPFQNAGRRLAKFDIE